LYLIANHFYLKIEETKYILLPILYLIILYDSPVIYLFYNYYKWNKTTEFTLYKNSNEIRITENGISKNYSLNDVKYSVYNLGKYWQNAIDNNYRLPTIFSEFGYWDLTFNNGDRYYLTTLLQDFLLEKDKVKETKYRFRLIPYIDKTQTELGIELESVEYKAKNRTEKLKENFSKKSKEELNSIIENKSKYQEEVIKVVEQILKEKNVG